MLKAVEARFFAYKIREGQEANVALFIDDVLSTPPSGPDSPTAGIDTKEIKSLLVLPNMAGIVIAETTNPRILETVLSGQRHYRGRIFGTVTYQELEPMIKPRTISELLNVGDEIEVVSGALRGSRGKVLRVDKARGEVTFQPAEVAVSMPMTISMESVKIVSQVQPQNTVQEASKQEAVTSGQGSGA